MSERSDEADRIIDELIVHPVAYEEFQNSERYWRRRFYINKITELFAALCTAAIIYIVTAQAQYHLGIPPPPRPLHIVVSKSYCVWANFYYNGSIVYDMEYCVER